MGELSILGTKLIWLDRNTFWGSFLTSLKSRNLLNFQNGLQTLETNMEKCSDFNKLRLSLLLNFPSLGKEDFFRIPSVRILENWRDCLLRVIDLGCGWHHIAVLFKGEGRKTCQRGLRSLFPNDSHVTESSYRAPWCVCVCVSYIPGIWYIYQISNLTDKLNNTPLRGCLNCV